jgi:hypothetical protein
MNIYDQCLEAFFDNKRFGNEVLYSRHRMQAVFDIMGKKCPLATVDGSADQGASKSGSAKPSS